MNATILSSLVRHILTAVGGGFFGYTFLAGAFFAGASAFFFAGASAAKPTAASMRSEIMSFMVGR